jgi:hypothetical protein
MKTVKESPSAPSKTVLWQQKAASNHFTVLTVTPNAVVKFQPCLLVNRQRKSLH